MGRRWALVVIASATLMVTLDATIVTVAMPAVRDGLRFAPAGAEWVVAAYSLAFGGLLLLGGRAGDLFGRRRVFLVGIGVFAVASLAGGLAVAPGWLVAARAAQGVGAAVAAPTALSLIATTFPEPAARGRAMAVYAAMSGSGGAVGMILGGLLTEAVTWRGVFFVNVPIGAFILLVAPRVLPADPPSRSGAAGRPDVLGALLATGGMTALVYGLIRATGHAFGAPGVLVPLAVAPVLLVAFVVVQARHPRPVLPLRLFADRNRSAAYLVTLAVGLGVYGLTFYLMLTVQDRLGFGPVRAGLAFLPLVAGLGVTAALAGRTITRFGPRLGVTLGPLLAAAGAAWLAWATHRITGGPGAGYLLVVGPMVLLGVGLGAAVVPLTLTALTAVRPADAGAASAMVSTGQQVGGGIGLAVLGTVAGAGRDYPKAFLVAAAVLAAASLVALALIRRRQQIATPPTAAPPAASPAGAPAGGGAEVSGAGRTGPLSGSGSSPGAAG